VTLFLLWIFFAGFDGLILPIIETFNYFNNTNPQIHATDLAINALKA
jgi:hypothetical protein